MLDLNEEKKKVAKELREKTAGYIIGAFGFVAGIAWNDAIKALIEYLFPLSKDANSIVLKFVYAIVVTIVIVFVTLYFLKFLKKEEK